MSTSAQTAPDFTVTDIYGVEHTLYEDHLSEGKAVILAFFYDGAPMLSEVFPLLQQYCIDKWEESLPISALLLSHVDSNAALLNFASNHGISLPIAGPEGGADEAIGPFIDGTFGDFYGYPMFVIVGPSGEVVYDPWAATPSAMIDAIDDAVLALLGITAVAESLPTSDRIISVHSGRIWVDLTMAASANAQLLTLHDLQGRLLLETQVFPGSLQSFLLPKGVPVVYALRGDLFHTGKVIIN